MALAELYRQGVGVPANAERAFNLLLEVASTGYAKAEYQVGLMYEQGVGVLQDLVAAQQWYQRAADHGDAAAKLKLAATQAH